MTNHTSNPDTLLWRVTHQWLKACGYKPDANYCREEITTHPDYPALTSVIDFLDSGGMAYQAVRADHSLIHEFNYPVLAHIRLPEYQYLKTVTSSGSWETDTDLKEHWTGVVIFPEKNTHWATEQHTAYRKRAKQQQLTALVLSLTGLAILVYTVSIFSNPLYPVFGFLSLCGLCISVYASGVEMGLQNQLVKQVCGAISKGGCERVLQSKYAVGWLGITPADVSLLYFCTQFICYAAGIFYPPLLSAMWLFAFGGIAVSAWSLFIQATKIRQWCALCLAIVLVLLLQAGLAFAIPRTPITYWTILSFAGLLLLLSAGFFPIKTLVKESSKAKLKLAELKKWKLDPVLFAGEWAKEQPVDTTVWPQDLLMGEADSPLRITAACSPYCNPCAITHRQLDQLLHRFSGILQVQVRLLSVPDDEANKYTVAVKSILRAARKANTEKDVHQMLSDWFEWMNDDTWQEKWKTDAGMDVHEALLRHQQWIAQHNIEYTPTLFINGRKIPGRYNLDDLAQLLPQLPGVLPKP